MNITDSIRRRAETEPTTIALIRADDIPVTYRALDLLIDNCARHLLAAGIVPGQTVGLSLAGPDEMLPLILLLAMARVGVASAAPSAPPARLAAICHLAGTPAPRDARAIAYDQGWLVGAGPPPPACRDGAAVFRVFATSGTTGSSRHCAVSHAEMAARVAANSVPELHPDSRTVMVCAMGLGGVAALRRVLLVLGSGGTLVFTNEDALGNAIAKHKVTVLVASVLVLQSLRRKLPRGVGPLPHLRVVIASGSHLPAALARDVAASLCPNVYTSFGSTEVAPIANGRFGAFADIPNAIGRLIPVVQAQAVDAGGNVLQAGEEGLLRFRGPGMATAYLDDPEATAATFHDGWFQSGDRGAVTADRVLVVTGRTGDFINSGGVKVNPRVIEAALLDLPAVREAVAFAVPDAHGLAQIWAAIAVQPPLDAGVVSGHCAERLGAQAPAMILQLKALPRTATGKVMVRELIAHAASLYRS